MSPLSILPGRIRLESRSLVGNFRECASLETTVNGLEGVLEASANPRTGRVMVRYDETRTDGDALMRKILNGLNNNGYNRIIHSRPSVDSTYPSAFKGSNAPRTPESFTARHAVIDILAHAVLPKPFNVLLPIAFHTIRK